MNEFETPTFGIASRTVFMDRDENSQLMILDGALPLPIGSQIELQDHDSNTPGTAWVRGVRLLAAPQKGGEVWVCLDCDVEPGWHERKG